MGSDDDPKRETPRNRDAVDNGADAAESVNASDAMNAMAADMDKKGKLDETIDHTPSGESATSGPPGGPSGGRYTFASGSRPLEGYTIKRAIGRGGFGEVYYATSDSGKDVALKLILRNLEVERRGVVQCMNLKCPNLLQIFDLKQSDDGDSFVIMEYVAGPNLSNVLAEYPDGMPQDEVRHWMRGIAAGVSYLHDHGIVHRDLKPANLFIEEGIVKIGDYGLSKLITPGRGSTQSESVGTCHYMAPEIASGKYDRPIDIYAMGIMLHEMLTGRVPFDGETVGEILMKHLTAQPDLSRLGEPYKSIVARALEKDPAKRTRSAYGLLLDDDAATSPGVRFIGEPQVDRAAAEPPITLPLEDPRPAAAAPPPRPAAPVYYIGPDTMPTRDFKERMREMKRRVKETKRAGQRRIVEQWRAAKHEREQAAARMHAERIAAHRMATGWRVDRKKPSNANAQPAAPPQPPTLPPTRVRIGELAGSMVLAALLCGVLAVPASSVVGFNPPRHPEQFGFLFGGALAATWAVLIATKVLEGRPIDRRLRRVFFLAVGIGVGGAIYGLGAVTKVELAPHAALDFGTEGEFNLTGLAGTIEHPALIDYATYFGLAFLLLPSKNLASRGRRRRFSIVAIALAAFTALIPSLLFPFAQPWGAAIVVLAAVSTQLASPWSEELMRYERAAGKAKRTARVA